MLKRIHTIKGENEFLIWSMQSNCALGKNFPFCMLACACTSFNFTNYFDPRACHSYVTPHYARVAHAYALFLEAIVLRSKIIMISKLITTATVNIAKNKIIIFTLE